MRFAAKYRKTFATLGYELRPRDGRAESRIAAAEKRLGIRLPTSLREYYLIAGAAHRFNDRYNRLLPPHEWTIDDGYLVFMSEHQEVVLWAVRPTAKATADPPAYLGANGEQIVWHVEHEKCSVFLDVMIHWHGATCGAMSFADTAKVDADLVKKLDREWRFVGEVNGMRAYNRPGQAVCFLPWSDDDWKRHVRIPHWRIFSGASTKELHREIGTSLNIQFEVGGDGG